MRPALALAADAGMATLTAEAREAYVYGSAEVVGLMCLQVFLHKEQRSPAELAQLDFGARNLGAALQDINFLRDLADDTHRLRRSYLAPTPRRTSNERDEWLGSRKQRLGAAENARPQLPADAGGA